MAVSAASKVVDFSNVKDGGNFNKKRITAGDYLAKITKVEDAESKSDKVFQYLFTVQIVKHPSSVLPYYCKLQENQLWKLRNILIAAGISVPKKRMKVEPQRLIGKLIGVTIEDTDWEDKEQSEIAGVFPAAELDDAPAGDDDDDEGEEDEGEEEEPEVAADDEDEEEAEDEEPEADDEPEDDGDEYDGMDRTELKNAIKASDPAFVARKSQTDDDLRAILRAGLAGGDDDEEEEEEAPAPKRRATTKAAPKKSSKAVSDDELEELDIDDL